MEDAVLTNRELAGLVVLAGLVAFVLVRPGPAGLLRSLGGVLAAVATPKIFVPLVLYAGWIAGAAVGASQVGLWNPSLVKVTILWLLFSGLVLIFHLSDAINKPGFFRQVLLRTLGAAVVVEYLATLKSFPLWVEIPAQALVFVFAGITVVAKGDNKHDSVVKVATGYLTIFGLSALIWTTTYLISSWASLDRTELLREFLLPFWMTPVALLFMYGFAVFAAYETTFKMMRVRHRDRSLGRQRLAIVVRANLRLGILRLTSGPQASRIARTKTFREAWIEIGRMRAEKRERLAEEAAARRRLVDNAGVPGTDEEGRQLDQREFTETCQALRWLSTCHMGHYRNGKQRYRKDLLPIVAPRFEQYGLPKDHGIRMQVSHDGQRWYATRQTVTGWWFVNWG
jgi:hypothetical protein